MSISKPDTARTLYLARTPDLAGTPAAERVTQTGGTSEQQKGTGWSVGLLALLPIACCGLPLLLAAGAAAGTGAVLGGAVGVVLLIAAALLAAVTLRRRRNAACRTDAGGPPESRTSGDGCC